MKALLQLGRQEGIGTLDPLHAVTLAHAEAAPAILDNGQPSSSALQGKIEEHLRRQREVKPLSDTRRLLASPLQRVTSAVEVAVGTAAKTGGLLLKHGSSTGSMGGSMGSMKDILSFRGTKEEGHLKRSQSVEMIAIATNELPAHVSGSIEEEDDGVEGFDIFSTAPRPLGGSRGSRGSGRALQNQTF